MYVIKGSPGYDIKQHPSRGRRVSRNNIFDALLFIKSRVVFLILDYTF